MKSLKSFFDHRRAHENIEEIWLPLFLTLSATLVPFFLVAPVPCTVACVFLLLWSLGLRAAKISMFSIPAYGLGFFVLMALKSSLAGGLWSREFFATIWVVFALCKSFRLKTYGDGEVLLILTLAGNACILLLDESVTVTVWTTVMTIITMGQLLRLNIKDVSSVTLLASLKSAALMTIYALPLLTFLFFMFHKAGAYHLNWKSGQGWSGISDHLEPGRVSKLALNTSPAFRAKLENPLPPLTQVYWRATTLNESRGLAWRRRSGSSRHSFLPSHNLGRCLVGQKIYIQQGSPLIFKVGLDHPVSLSVVGDNPYVLISDICGWRENLSDKEKAEATTLKFNPSPRLKQLVGALTAGATGPKDVLERILAYYKKENFKYTLSTGPASSQMNLDQFLFQKKSGFCEHFAAATATLLRLAGVPSRVVVGFQGGDYNSVGGYWLVSYSDAHAWVEMWTRDKGWMRVDPTTVVYHGTKSHPIEFLKWASEAADAFFFEIGTFFNNREKLFSLSDFTFDSWLALICLSLLFLSLQTKKWLRPVEKAVVEDFDKFCRLLGERGLPRKRSEGFEDYRGRALRWLETYDLAPATLTTVDGLFLFYIDFRYGPSRFTPEDLKSFCQRLRQVQRKMRWETSSVKKFFRPVIIGDH